VLVTSHFARIRCAGELGVAMTTVHGAERLTSIVQVEGKTP
jgi:hypothetical protein